MQQAAMERRQSHGPSLMIVIGGPEPKPKRDSSPPEKQPYPPSEEDEPDTDEEEDDEDDAEDDLADADPTPEELDNKRIVVEAMQALEGKHDNPSFALNEYIATYGKRDLDELRKMVTGKREPQRAAEGRLIEGPGSGLDDRIRAQIGTQPVLLSDGEYVLPADVVSGLGNGSTKGGVRVLEAMMDRIRQSRTGTTRQASGLDLQRVLPK